jgi:hypothetical protein
MKPRSGPLDNATRTGAWSRGSLLDSEALGVAGLVLIDPAPTAPRCDHTDATVVPGFTR